MGLLDFIFGSSENENNVEEPKLKIEEVYSDFDIEMLQESPLMNERWIGDKVIINEKWLNDTSAFVDTVESFLRENFDYEDWKKYPFIISPEDEFHWRSNTVVIGFLDENLVQNSDEDKSELMRQAGIHPEKRLFFTPFEDIWGSEVMTEISSNLWSIITGGAPSMKGNRSGIDVGPEERLVFAREKLLRLETYDFEKRLQLHQEFPEVDEEIFVDPLKQDISWVYSRVKGDSVTAHILDLDVEDIDRMLEKHNIDYSS